MSIPSFKLLTAEDARQVLESDVALSTRSLQRRIKDAYDRHDPDVRLVGGSYVAPEQWWRDELRRVPPGTRNKPK